MWRSRSALSVAVAGVCVAAASLVSCGGKLGPTAAAGDAVIVVSVPVEQSPWVARFAARGAQLAAQQLNRSGGVAFGKGMHRVSIVVEDNHGSAQSAVAIARSAVADHAIAIITDGTGARAVAAVTDPAKVAVFVVFDGGDSIVDPVALPTIFRIAPADRPMAIRLADYVAATTQSVAVISDTSSFGDGGAAALGPAFVRDHIKVAVQSSVAVTSSDLSGPIAQARRAGVDALVVWGSGGIVAATVRAARQISWKVRIYSGPTAEDPIVRQLLDDHPTWLDGVTFVSFRITAEVGPAPFERFRHDYESAFGRESVGVKSGGKTVFLPPDWAMLSFDATRLMQAVLKQAGGAEGGPLMDALNSVVITGANGDERGFGPQQREGVSPDDMYFAVFKDKVFSPVRDDVLSTNLPFVGQS